MSWFSKIPVTHKKFRQSLVESLMHEKMSASGGMQTKRGIPSSVPTVERLNGVHHRIERMEKGPAPCLSLFTFYKS
jgi:hypothetical protein